MIKSSLNISLRNIHIEIKEWVFEAIVIGFFQERMGKLTIGDDKIIPMFENFIVNFSLRNIHIEIKEWVFEAIVIGFIQD